MNIQGIGSVNSIIGSSSINQATEANEKVSFRDLLIDALDNVNTLEQESNRMTEDFIAGRTDNIHSVLIAGEKASIALDFVIQVRNKIMEAYNEIMRMQV